jgi:hypothetical protein
MYVLFSEPQLAILLMLWLSLQDRKILSSFVFCVPDNQISLDDITEVLHLL